MLNISYTEGGDSDPFEKAWTIRLNQSSAVNSMAISMFGETRDILGATNKTPMRTDPG